MKELICGEPSKLKWIEGPEPTITAPDQALVPLIASVFFDLDRRIRQ